MRFSIWPHTTCRPSQRLAQPAAEPPSPTSASSESSGSSWRLAAVGKMYRRSWAAPAGPPIASSNVGRRWAVGTGSTRTCCVCCDRRGKLDPDLVIIDAVLVRAFGGGDLTGPSPVDRRKKGSKHTRDGVDRAWSYRWPSARREPMPATTGRSSRWVRAFPRGDGASRVGPKELPDEAYADRGYDSDTTPGF